MDFFNKQHRRKHVTVKLIFDIGSSSVGCAVVSFPVDNSKPSLLFVKRTPIVPPGEFNHERLVRQMTAALLLLCEAVRTFLLQNKSVGGVDEICCVLSSLWHSSQTYTLKKRQEDNLTVSIDFLEELLQQEMGRSNEEYDEDLKRKYIHNPVIFERRILEIALNGYKIVDPIGKLAKDIELSIFSAVMDSALCKKIHDTIGGQFNNVSISFHSHTLSLFLVIRNYLNENSNFILLNINGEMTDITFIEDDILGDTVSIPTGTNTIMRAVAKKRGGSTEEALSLLCLTGEGGQIDHESREYKVVQNIGLSWRAEVFAKIKKSTYHFPTSQHFFLVATPNFASWFKELIEKMPEVEEDGHLPTFRPFVASFSSAMTKNFIESKRGVIIDPILTVEALHIARL